MHGRRRVRYKLIMDEIPLDSPQESRDPYQDLTPEQEKALTDFWNLTPNNPPSLMAISEKIFGQIHDGRSWQMRAIKKSLSQRNLKTKRNDTEKPEFQLTEEHKLFITNNAATMTAVELGRTLLNNPNLSNLHKEIRVINEFVKTLDTRVVMNNGKDTTDVPDGEYKPPKRPENALFRVNQYLNLSLDIKKLTPTQKKCIDSLIGYLHTYRFVHQMSSYEKESDRKLCEDSFIRGTWDKPDLTQEEIDRYITLAHEPIIQAKSRFIISKLEKQLDYILGTDPETAKMSMSLSDSIGKTNIQLHDSIKRQGDLHKSLTEQRSDKLAKQIKDNASILNLVELWKNEESRRDFIALGMKEQSELKDEVERLKTLPEIKCRIMGITENEAIY